jgi:hypothetical protein
MGRVVEKQVREQNRIQNSGVRIQNKRESVECGSPPIILDTGF